MTFSLNAHLENSSIQMREFSFVALGMKMCGNCQIFIITNDTRFVIVADGNIKVSRRPRKSFPLVIEVKTSANHA